MLFTTFLQLLNFSIISAIRIKGTILNLFFQNRIIIMAFLKSYKKLGQRDGLSQLDIQKLNRLYSCGDKITKPPTEIKCVDVYTNGNIILLLIKFEVLNYCCFLSK